MVSLKKMSEQLDSIGAAAATMKFPNVRTASGVSNRNEQIMTWRLPNGSSVQMYINPESFTLSESKQINFTRTKGGFVVQYWGENLGRITLSGTTGSSGVRGINIIRDVYKSENRAFELVAGSQANSLISTIDSGLSTDQDIGTSLAANVAKEIRERGFILRPSLASLALGIILYYNGVQYKGFFTEFNVTESVQKLGLFDYNLTFMVTETRGVRENFMPWHKEPIADSPGDQLANAALNAAGNQLRNFAGLGPQTQTPLEYHPENAPLSFDNTISTIFDY